MSILVGTKEISSIHVGNKEVLSVWKGTHKVYEKQSAYPVKGQLITMTLGNATPERGTQDLYRVVKINGSIAEVLAMYSQVYSIQFTDTSGSSLVGCEYEGGVLDDYLNDTFYGSLSATAKSAIVDKTFTQDAWYSSSYGNPIYTGHYGAAVPGTGSYTISLDTASFGNSITRHVYAPSVQDVIDYVTDTTVGDGLLENYNIWKLFWNTNTSPSIADEPWLRTTKSESSVGWYIVVISGKIAYKTGRLTASARPMLTIDLSKISWS